MNLTIILDALAKAGASNEMIIAAVRAYESDINEKAAIRKEQARQRKIKQRQRIKSLEYNDRVTDVPVTSRDACDTPPSNGSDGFNGFPHPSFTSLTSLTTPPKINPKGFTKGTPTIEENFAELWEIFPRQRRGSKEAGLRAYRAALARASPAEILAGAASYAASDEVARGFAKGAAAWLNDDRWTTDYAMIGMQNAKRGNDTKPTPTGNALAALYAAGTESRRKQQERVQPSAGGFQAAEPARLAGTGNAPPESQTIPGHRT